MGAFTKKGELAIIKPEFKKIETEVTGGLARITQRFEMVKAKLVMGYEYNGTMLEAGDSVILRADSGLQNWAKTTFILNGVEFVLCPEAAVIAFESSK
jgi:hypothetical protein